MDALLKAINDVVQSRDDTIYLLKWENDKLKAEIAELRKDIEKYKENEAKRV